MTTKKTRADVAKDAGLLSAESLATVTGVDELEIARALQPGGVLNSRRYVNEFGESYIWATDSKWTITQLGKRSPMPEIDTETGWFTKRGTSTRASFDVALTEYLSDYTPRRIQDTIGNLSDPLARQFAAGERGLPKTEFKKGLDALREDPKELATHCRAFWQSGQPGTVGVRRGDAFLRGECREMAFHQLRTNKVQTGLFRREDSVAGHKKPSTQGGTPVEQFYRLTDEQLESIREHCFDVLSTCTLSLAGVRVRVAAFAQDFQSEFRQNWKAAF